MPAGDNGRLFVGQTCAKFAISMHIGVVCADRKSGGCPAASDTFESGTALGGNMATSTGDRSAKVSLEHHVSGEGCWFFNDGHGGRCGVAGDPLSFHRFLGF